MNLSFVNNSAVDIVHKPRNNITKTSQNTNIKYLSKIYNIIMNFQKYLPGIIKSLDKNVQFLNTSKVFAGIMIILLNISSRHVNIKLSKSVESYLKHTFSKQILVFTIAWMGSRDIYTALIITIIFIVITEYLFNEESSFCCLSESFTDYHLNIDENGDGIISDEELEKAKEIIERAEQQKTENRLHTEGFMIKL